MKAWAGIFVLIFVSFVSCTNKNEKPAQIILNNAGSKYGSFCAAADEYLLESGFSGSVLVAHGKKIVFAKGYELCDKKNEASGTNDIWTTFEAGSLTKQFVAAAVLQLEKQGKLKRKDSVSKYFNVLKGKKFEPITVEMLLNMKSGLGDHINGAEEFFPRKVNKMIGRKQLLNEEVEEELILKYLPKTELIAAPDSTYFYSNTNYYLLAKIIEKVSGLTYAEYMKNLLEKAEMESSNVEFQSTIAKGYAGENYYSIPRAFAIGCGDLNTNVIDLYRWNVAFAGGKICSKKILNQLKNGNGYLYGFYCGKGKIFHAGITNVFNSYSSYDFKSKIQIIVLSNKPVSNCNATKIAGGLQSLIAEN